MNIGWKYSSSVEPLPSKGKVLSSNPSTESEREIEKEREREPL
jgi:hypothetical protein